MAKYKILQPRWLLLMAMTTLLCSVMLACGPADVPPEQRLNNPPVAEPLAVTEPPLALPEAAAPRVGAQEDEGSPTLDSTPTPTTPPLLTVNQFRSHCSFRGFNMFRRPVDDLEANVWCYGSQLEEYLQWLTILPGTPSLTEVQQAYTHVQDAVDRDPDVVAGRAKVLSCLAAKGHSGVDADLLFPWQAFTSADAYEATQRALTPAQRTQQIALYVPSDECANTDSAYYYLQGLAWRAELKALKSSDKAKLKSLENAQVVYTVDKPGRYADVLPVPNFLTLSGGRIFRDGAGNAHDPMPTPYPTSGVARAAADRSENLDHPQGLAGCQAYNRFGIPHNDLLKYGVWCTEETGRTLLAECDGVSGTSAQLSCADSYLASWQEQRLRALHRCAVVTDADDAQSCREASSSQDQAKAFGRVYGQVLATVAADADVGEAHADVIQCLEDRSFSGIEGRVLFHWQKVHQYTGDIAAMKVWDKSFTSAEHRLANNLTGPANTCAVDNGLYTAQEAAWLAEVRRLQEEDPDQVQPLIDWGLLAVLERDGVAPFLMFSR